MDDVEAVKESWKMTDGYSWPIFFTGFLVVFIAILGLLFLGIGIIISIMWIKLAFAAIYFSADRQFNNKKDLM